MAVAHIRLAGMMQEQFGYMCAAGTMGAHEDEEQQHLS
jgi:hypothetical protein